jgi:predicted AlkP superfamily phosphohydrolase/phosphomutase
MAKSKRKMRLKAWVIVSALVLILVSADATEAYIGPGAGFALLSSFLVLFTTILLAVASLLVWPFRALIRFFKYRGLPRPSVRRLVIMGFDGQDPELTERFMAEGKLPHFKKLAETGCYKRLRTTFPSISPVAWSSFATGTNPARHNIFDFLDRDPRTYLPLLSSTRIGKVDRVLKLGRYRIPLRKPELRLLRKSKPFWTILGEHRIWSTVLRVPITFPPDRFYGAELSAMCAPDLLGSQGTFLLYTTRRDERRIKEGGTRVLLEPGDRMESVIRGPENTFLEGNPSLEVPLIIELDRNLQEARLTAGGDPVVLTPGRLSDWITLSFRAAPGIKVSGVCRFMVTELGEHFSLYVTPICIDPERPAMPISHPSYYATYLAKKIGPFSTLGLAEDTWALNEGVTDEATFLRQTYDIDRERQAMFFTAWDRLRRGTLVCVFDATDRIQHMFWRYFENQGKVASNGHSRAIEDIYLHNDELLGKALERLERGDLLLVVSDHGFKSFRRGVNLNAWLRDQGYLFLKGEGDGKGEWFQGVDWSRTKAYQLGLTGLFLNLDGREAQGIVHPGEGAARLKAELMGKLGGLVDTETGEVGIREVFDTAKVYEGPYRENAPDLLVGYNAGYRVSWDGATGVVAGLVFEDNRKCWSGDHCIDPRLVPGVLFSTHPIDTDDPALIDVAPSVLRLFGLTPPGHMDGRPFFDPASFSKTA